MYKIDHCSATLLTRLDETLATQIFQPEAHDTTAIQVEHRFQATQVSPRPQLISKLCWNLASLNGFIGSSAKLNQSVGLSAGNCENRIILETLERL